MPDLSLFDISHRKALVTGAARGIGRACATALAMGGADVAIADIDEEAGNQAVEAIKQMGVDAFFVHCDASDEQQVDAMVEAVVERFGRLDIAVNNAGIGLPGGDIDQSKQDWDKVIGLNLTGVWLCAKAEAKQMIKQGQGGKIINTASAGARNVSVNASYAASKAGVVHLTHSLAANLGTYNINVNCFSPGIVITKQAAGWQDYLERIREITPMGHVGRPEDMYGTILFLASDASNYVTGHDLLVDGGRTLSTWIAPLKRAVPPRVSPKEEIAEITND